MESVTHVVEVFLGYDRPTQPTTWDWVKWRADFFHRYTMKSLRAQTCPAFILVVQAGLRHRAMLESYPWAPEVHIVFDQGQVLYGTPNPPDYVAITRLDSDDLLHRQAIEEIVAATSKFHNGRDKNVLVFKRGIYWDIENKFIGPWLRSSSPFFTHIFPRRVVQNWAHFKSLHFLPHGKAGDREGFELTEGRVCVVKHSKNWSYLKRGLTPPVLTAEQRLGFAAADERLILDRERIVRILQKFGLGPEDVPE